MVRVARREVLSQLVHISRIKTLAPHIDRIRNHSHPIGLRQTILVEHLTLEGDRLLTLNIVHTVCVMSVLLSNGICRAWDYEMTGVKQPG